MQVRSRLMARDQPRIPADQRADGHGMQPTRVIGQARQPFGRRVNAARDARDVSLARPTAQPVSGHPLGDQFGGRSHLIATEKYRPDTIRHNTDTAIRGLQDIYRVCGKFCQVFDRFVPPESSRSLWEEGGEGAGWRGNGCGVRREVAGWRGEGAGWLVRGGGGVYGVACAEAWASGWCGWRAGLLSGCGGSGNTLAKSRACRGSRKIAPGRVVSFRELRIRRRALGRP